MPIIMYLGKNVNEYERLARSIAEAKLSDGSLMCEECGGRLSRHSWYKRRIKENGMELEIAVVWCRECRKWHALLPDFILPHKQYSANEIESAVIDWESGVKVKDIDTKASEVTVRRWLRQMKEKLEMACSVIMALFLAMGCAISELVLEAKGGYRRLEEVLLAYDGNPRYSGNKLGLANMWLCTNKRSEHI